MPVTTIDPIAALVVIDMQKGVLALPTVHPAAEVLARVVRLTDAFRAKARPVVLVHVGWAPGGADAVKSRNQSAPPLPSRPADFFEYADELRADPKRDILIQKRQWGAFYGTDLDLQLRRPRDHPHRAVRDLDQHWGRIDRARCLGALVQSHLRFGCDDRYGQGGTRARITNHLPTTRGDRHRGRYLGKNLAPVRH